jgi:hypothetical protein
MQTNKPKHSTPAYKHGTHMKRWPSVLCSFSKLALRSAAAADVQPDLQPAAAQHVMSQSGLEHVMCYPNIITLSL